MKTMAASNHTGLSKGLAAFDMKILPEDFVLSDNDVICGRGSRCFNHAGNQRFRKMVDSFLQKYSNPNATKLDKSNTIQEVVSLIRSGSQKGGFVKLDLISGRYFEVSDFLAREKTSQAFRDALHDQYKSSNEKKKEYQRLLKEKRKITRSAAENIVVPVVSSDSSTSGSSQSSDTLDEAFPISTIPSSALGNEGLRERSSCEDKVEKNYCSDQFPLYDEKSSYARRLSVVTPPPCVMSAKRYSMTTSFFPLSEYDIEPLPLARVLAMDAYNFEANFMSNL
jgi:hypothetical protein